jgi:hypothetical protein
MLIQDVRLLDNLQIISESNARGTMKIRGIFQRADEDNNNKRRYPRKVLEGQVKSIQEAINDGRQVGELDHPDYDIVKLSNASHRITGLRMEGNDVIGDAELLSTPSGRIAQALIKDGVKLGISSRGMGSLTENDDGTKTVNEDFKLITFENLQILKLTLRR